ncbi:MAG: hypothetical protein AAGH67_17750 [Cyanobacteria bacterium P01_H01_bin.162]
MKSIDFTAPHVLVSFEPAMIPRMAVLYPFVAIAMILIDRCGYRYRPLGTVESALRPVSRLPI